MGRRRLPSEHVANPSPIRLLRQLPAGDQADDDRAHLQRQPVDTAWHGSIRGIPGQAANLSASELLRCASLEILESRVGRKASHSIRSTDRHANLALSNVDEYDG